MLNKSSDKISIVIPAYNIADYIGRCIESVLNQTYKNIEIVIVNDGSTDDTEQVAKNYCEKDIRIKLITKINEGVSKARITGIQASTGEWIGFVDGDDVIDSDMYERLLSNAKKHNADISHCGYKMVFPNDRVDYYYNTGRLVKQDGIAGVKDLLSGAYIEPGLWNKLFHNSLFHNLLQGEFHTDIKINEDLLMNYYLFKAAKSAVYEDFCPYNYILRKGSAATSQINENKLKDPLKVLKIIKDDCNNNQILNEIVTRRITARLVGTAVLSSKVNPQLIKPYKKQARRELRKTLPQVLRIKGSLKIKLIAVWVAVWPWSYSVIHNTYAKISGVDKKYEIN